MTNESASDEAPRVEPVTEDDWIVHSVNIHGAFFERACRKIIEDTPLWSVSSTNMPVEFPPPTDHSRGKESNLDIWATLKKRSGIDGGERILSLLIECKKNNPEFVKWLFFPKHPGPGQFPEGPTTNRIAVRQVGLRRESGSANNLTVLPQVARRRLDRSIVIADEARETRGAYKDHKNVGTKTKTANTAITEAAYQVALATQAIFFSESQFLKLSLDSVDMPRVELPDVPWVKQMFLPIVVTSAQLFTCDFRTEDINPVSGEIPFSKVAVTEQQQLIFEYPLPRHLQVMPSHSLPAGQEMNIDTFSRMHIPVVHSGYLPEFLRQLAHKDLDLLLDY